MRAKYESYRAHSGHIKFVMMFREAFWLRSLEGVICNIVDEFLYYVRARMVMAGTFCFILMASFVQAGIASVDPITVNPQKIPINGTVEITITSIGTTTLTSINVIDWLGARGVSGWIDPWGNPGADTSLAGECDVDVPGFAIKFDAFEVISAGVPEFPLAVPILTSLVAALYLVLRKRIAKNLE